LISYGHGFNAVIVRLGGEIWIKKGWTRRGICGVWSGI